MHLIVKQIIGSVVKIVPGNEIFLQFCLTSKLLSIYVPILPDSALCLIHSYEILSLEKSKTNMYKDDMIFLFFLFKFVRSSSWTKSQRTRTVLPHIRTKNKEGARALADFLWGATPSVTQTRS